MKYETEKLKRKNTKKKKENIAISLLCFNETSAASSNFRKEEKKKDKRNEIPLLFRPEEDAFAQRFRWRPSSSISTLIIDFAFVVFLLLQTGR